MMVLCRLKHVGANNFNYNFNWGCVFFKVFYVKYFRKYIKKGASSWLSLQRQSYVYWTMHHLDRWIKRDQLDVTCFIISLFNAQHVSDVNTSILRSWQLICSVISWVVLLCKDRGYCISVHKHANAITSILTEQYNPWNNWTNKSQAPQDGCINIWNMLSIK